MSCAAPIAKGGGSALVRPEPGRLFRAVRPMRCMYDMTSCVVVCGSMGEHHVPASKSLSFAGCLSSTDLRKVGIHDCINVDIYAPCQEISADNKINTASLKLFGMWDKRATVRCKTGRRGREEANTDRRKNMRLACSRTCCRS